MSRRIYLASSWRNERQPAVLKALRTAGHEVYDFRNPAPGNTGFQWSSIDPDWQSWSPALFRGSLMHPVAVEGEGLDRRGMDWADTCVLLLPCGRSAHLEAGFMAGAGKDVHVLVEERCEPELMYRLMGEPWKQLHVSLAELLRELEAAESGPAPRMEDDRRGVSVVLREWTEGAQ